MVEETRFLTVQDDHENKRLDVFIKDELGELSRSAIQKLINEGNVFVNNGNVKSNYKVRIGDCIKILIPEAKPLEIKAEKIPLEILYEDSDVVVINKPQGMVVHPAVGNYHGTLVNALLEHCEDLSGINGLLRPGIVHRLDKDTSGVIMVAKNDSAHVNLAAQIKARTVKRKYIALVYGNIQADRGKIDAPIGRHPIDRKKMAVTHKNGRHAVTHYRVLERFGNYTLVEAGLETGRTHQIRVHMSHIGHPLVGDPKYTKGKNEFRLKGQFLHAYLLGFFHPRTGKYMEFTSPLPEEMEKVLQKLRGE